jgi:hypothetical protein
MTRYAFYNMTLKELDALKAAGRELPAEHADVHEKLKARARRRKLPPETG